MSWLLEYTTKLKSNIDKMLAKKINTDQEIEDSDKYLYTDSNGKIYAKELGERTYPEIYTNIDKSESVAIDDAEDSLLQNFKFYGRDFKIDRKYYPRLDNPLPLNSKNITVNGEKTELRSLEEVNSNFFDMNFIELYKNYSDGMIVEDGYIQVTNNDCTLNPSNTGAIVIRNYAVYKMSWDFEVVSGNSTQGLIELTDINNENNKYWFYNNSTNMVYPGVFSIKFYKGQDPTDEENNIVKYSNIKLFLLNTPVVSNPNVRDYKIVDHVNKKSKIIRNIKKIRITPEVINNGWDVWEPNNYSPNVLINLPDRIVIDTITDINNKFSNIARTSVNSLANGEYITDIAGSSNVKWYPRYSNLNIPINIDKEEADARLVQYLTDNEIYIQYQLATPVEEEISYIENDICEFGYTWQESESPSVDIPRKINKIDTIEYTSMGKNLFDISKYTSNIYYDETINGFTGENEYIEIDIDDIWDFCYNMNKKIFIVSFDIKTTTDDGYIIVYTLGSKQLVTSNSTVYCGREWSSQSVIFDTMSFTPYNPNGDICRLSFYGTYGSGKIPSIRNICITIIDDENLDFIPYKETQSYQITPPYPLYSIADNSISDVANSVTGNYEYYINTIILDGSEDEEWTFGVGDAVILDNTIRFVIYIEDAKDTLRGYVNNFKNSYNYIDIYTDKEIAVFDQYYDKYLRIRIDKSRLETPDVDGLRKYLAANPIELSYVKDTMTTSPIPEEDLKKMKESKTVYGVNNIFCNAIISCTYKKSFQISIDKILKQIEENNKSTKNLEVQLLNNKIKD